MAWGRYLGLVNISLTGVLALFFILSASEEARRAIDNSHHVLPMAVKFIPVPIAFLFWIRLVERNGRLAMRSSPVWLGLSVGLFISSVLVSFPPLRQFCIATAVLSGLCVYVSPREYWGRIRREPVATLVLLIAATASINYYWLMQALWVEMRGLTTEVVYFVLKLFGTDAYAVIHPRVNTTIFIRSPNFMIWVNNACNGLEGIFLFNFLLSIMFLLDWDIFRRSHIFLIYVFGVIYMFIINSLRITVFFTVGYWAYKPGVPEWVSAMRGWPVMMFHSWIGWVLYLIAFGLFALVLYRSVGRKNRIRKSPGPASS